MNIEAIKERARYAIEFLNGRDPYVTDRGGIVLLCGPYPVGRANHIAEFYREAKADIPALIVEVEQLQAIIAALKTDNHRLRSIIGTAKDYLEEVENEDICPKCGTVHPAPHKCPAEE